MTVPHDPNESSVAPLGHEEHSTEAQTSSSWVPILMMTFFVLILLGVGYALLF